MEYEVLKDNSFIVTNGGKVIYTSRPYRTPGQASAIAEEWIRNRDNPPTGGITLDVQSLSVDAKTIFGGMRNG